MDAVFMVRGHGFDFVGNSPHTETHGNDNVTMIFSILHEFFSPRRGERKSTRQNI